MSVVIREVARLSVLGAAALELAEVYGLPVFPCRSTDQMLNGKTYKAKSPLTPRGFKDATRNLEQIEQWWTTWPDALIGIPTGSASGLFVIDVDPRGLEWFAEHSAELAPSRIHHTRRGRHLLYRACGLGNSSGTLADGVDTRGDGGYIIWWPACGLPVVGETGDVGDIPPWVLAALIGSTKSPWDATSGTRHTSSSGADSGVDRSRDLLRLVGIDVRAGLSDGEIIDRHRVHPHAKDQSDPERAVRRCIEKARREPAKNDENYGTLDVRDFYSYMPMHQYIFTPSRELWPASSVNARCGAPHHDDGIPATKRIARKVRGKGDEVAYADVPMTPAEYVDKYRPVDQMTWAPGAPMIVRNRLVANGGWIEREGVACFNQYRPPVDIPGDAAQAGRWVDHVEKVFGDDADHIVAWLAHRVQRPEQKINHALVLGGVPGIGKDSTLEPVKHAVGPWNFEEVQPTQLLGRFNSFLKSVVLRVSEARDLGDVDRYAFYDHMKVLTAAPPDVLRCDEKHLREHSVLNVTGVIITTNVSVSRRPS